MSIHTNATLSDIVRQHHLSAPVLEKYHLDFCCKGKQSLATACEEKGLNLEDVLQALNIAVASTNAAEHSTASMNVEELIAYIVQNHHEYVLQQGAAIQMHLTKVAGKHGDRFPYMIKVWELFMPVFNELRFHLQQEEQVLFPRIKEVFYAYQKNAAASFTAAYLQAPIDDMEGDHHEVGAVFDSIRKLTNDYEIPDGACNTFRLLLTELQAFEEDLHRHVHLENHVLFPAALQFITAA